MDFLIFLLTIPIICSFLIRLRFHQLTWQFFAAPSPPPPEGTLPTASILIPVRGLDQNAQENYQSYCQQDYDAPYEVIFALEDDDDPAVPVIQSLIQSTPDCDIKLVFSHDIEAIGKIKNQIAATHICKYDLWILVDSDVQLQPDFLYSQAARIMELSEVGLCYAAPIAIGSENWVAALHNIAVTGSLLNYCQAASQDNLTSAVGSCIVTRRDVIEKIGGLETFADRLVGLDVSLGQAVFNAGFKINLLQQPARIYHRRDQFTRYWWQSHRWLATIGHYYPTAWIFILLFAFPFWWALAFWITALKVDHFQELGLALMVIGIGADVISAAVINSKLVHDQQLWKFLWVSALSQFFLLPNLLHSLVSKRVKWRGRWLPIDSLEDLSSDSLKQLNEHQVKSSVSTNS